MDCSTPGLPIHHQLNSLVIYKYHSVAQSWPLATPWTAACQTSLSFTISWSFLKLMSIELVMPSNHLILCCPLLLLPSIFPSIRVFETWVSSSNQVAKILGFQLQPQSSQWIFRVDFLKNWLVWWFDLSAVQGTLKSLLQHHNLKASIIWHSAFFMVQLSHPYTITGKNIALTMSPLSVKWCLCFLIRCLGLS